MTENWHTSESMRIFMSEYSHLEGIKDISLGLNEANPQGE